MNRVNGEVVVAESGAGIPDLLVSAYDVNGDPPGRDLSSIASFNELLRTDADSYRSTPRSSYFSGFSDLSGAEVGLPGLTPSPLACWISF